ncbi:MAG: hypothetical protein K2N90_06285, partial [Lachnospiraceae bacterium]|nr:hypothetical protein [Lachnospiraceae bacterium]
MNKIRGSVIAKLIAWVLCIGSALGTAVFGFLTLAGVSTGYYNMTYEEMLADTYRNVNSTYSADVFQDMKNHRRKKTVTEEGFRYGIFQTQDLEKVDFQDETLYIDTNMTDEELKNLDRNKIFLYQIRQLSNGGQEGQAYGYVSDWENLSDLQSITSNLEEQDDVVWSSQYADAVCFDTEKGIFYYRSDEKYYPVREVTMYYDNDFGIVNEYSYIYDDTLGKYRLNYYNNGYGAYGIVIEEAEYDDAQEWSATVAEDSIDRFLKGDEAKEYVVDFATLNKTIFGYRQWGTLVLDNVREIDGEELTIINSKNIAKSSFADLDAGQEYYLDDNYTLHVAQEVAVDSYWVASLIPDVTALVIRGSRYYMSAKATDLFYTYGKNACAVTVVFAIMTLVSFVFLVYACGYRKNQEGIVLTWFDRLPLEVISAAAFFAELVPLSVIHMLMVSSEIRNNIEMLIPLVVSVAAGLCMIALWYVLSLCVRLKYGKWWRNTICYKICSFAWNTVRKLFDNITLLWKLILFVLVKSLIELFMMAACSVDGELVFLWFVETVLLTAAAFYAVLQINELQKAAGKMADGNLGYKVRTEKMFSPCKKHGDNLNKIGEGLSKAVDERLKSERFKTELITNVSHDIKTPLTSIINYVDLLEKEELHNEKAEEYLDVLERQSSKLKKLIEDLVEASKASTGNLEVGNELLEAGVFLTQT